MIVYIALRDYCDYSEVCAVFTDKEKADQYAKDHYDVEIVEKDTEDPAIYADKIFRVALWKKKVVVNDEYDPNEYYGDTENVHKLHDGHYYTYVICKDISSAIDIATERFDTYLRMEKRK